MAFPSGLTMGDSSFPKEFSTAASGYLHEMLLPENVFGHTKKVRLFREAIERFRNANENSSLHILDIGCGSGYAVTRFLARTGDHVQGIDMHPPNIAYAEKHFGGGGLSFACMDAQTLSTTGEVFDVIVMADVLEHLEDPVSILKTAVRLLSLDGMLLVTVPNGKGPFEIESALSRVPFLGHLTLKFTDLLVAMLNKTIMKGAWNKVAAQSPKDLPYNIESGHVQFFSAEDMLKLFKDSGMEVTSTGNVSFLSGPFANYLFAPSQRFCCWNARVADCLPRWITSAWFFECRRIKCED